MVDVGGIPMVMTGGGGWNNDGGMGGGIWAILLLALLGGRGFGGRDGGRDGCCPPATCQDVNEAAHYTEYNGRFNEIDNRIDHVNDLAEMRATHEAVCGVNQNVTQQAYNLDKSILLGNCETQKEVLQNRYLGELSELRTQAQIAACCCELKSEGFMNTQKILDKMNCAEVKGLEMRLSEKDLALSQCAQNAYLTQALRPYPVPAFPSCNPMTAGFGFGFPHDGFRNDGCGRCC